MASTIAAYCSLHTAVIFSAYWNIRLSETDHFQVRPQRINKVSQVITYRKYGDSIQIITCRCSAAANKQQVFQIITYRKY